MNELDPGVEFSAKIRKILLELHDYSFFHGPSEIGNIDERFFGRKPIIDKLKTILTNHETKSGAYMVTGYRGVGKSSLIAKVLSDISSGYRRSGRSSRYFRILAPLLPLALLQLSTDSPLGAVAVLVPLAVFAAGLYYLMRTDPKRDDLRLGPDRPWGRVRDVLQRIPRAFYMGKERSPDLRFRTLIQDFFLLSALHLAALAVLAFLAACTAIDVSALAVRLAVYGLLFVALFLLILVWSEAKQAHRRADPTRPRLWRAVGAHLLHSLRNHVNYSHRVYVKINLGQDDLREIEILRLIASNILTKYQAFRRSGLAGLRWRLLRVAILFFVVGTLYYYPPIYNLNRGLKLRLQLHRYFPSQGSFLLRHGTADLDRILADLSRSGSFDIADFDRAFDAHLHPDNQAYGLTPRRPAMSSLRRATVSLLGSGDLFAHIVYSRLRDNVPALGWFRSLRVNRVGSYHLRSTSRDFQIVPAQLDYLFVFYFLLAWYLVGLLSRFRLFGIATHGVILRLLRDLNDLIEAQVTKEQSGSMNAGRSTLGFNLLSRNSRSYPIATVRDIEKRLIEILDEIDRIPRLTVRPNFIFVFDELDKIEAHSNLTILQREEEVAPRPADANGYEPARERQHRILSLLSNLKHFFTTAKAKFIFIAGREMFDASLADVSDRHFFLGSIFNDVIYVPSFLRDPSDRRLADVTSMTETYVCRFLLPPRYRDSEVSLRSYNEYLKTEFFDESAVTGELERSLIRRRREKILFELRAFIIYLTYRSNGAPKKITRLIESHIRRPQPRDFQDGEYLCVGKCSGSLYLDFGYYDQYTFGLVAYIANPLFLSLNKTIKDFGDKLLVSTSFLLDHVYKFHGFGFSWRNLELIPEIIDVNKAPELRQLIGNIIAFLSRSHIEEIVSGLYDFKFRKQVIEEISFLSKVSEREAAAFNFTLDESLSLKRHYNRKLYELSSGYDVQEIHREGNYIHALSFVRMVLGDLHLYDEEYDQAIIHYMEAVQSVQAVPAEKLTIHRLVVIVRNLLKLGLAFERKKTFDSAFVTYGKLVSLLVRFRDLDLATFNLADGGLQDGEPERLYRRQDLAQRRKAPKPQSWERLTDALRHLPFGADREDLAFKISTFEGIRLIYQPLLAKLQVIEKANLGGITQPDLATVDDEFDFLGRILHQEENFLITAEFREKVGDILFYKNGPVAPPPIYCHRSGALCSPNRQSRMQILDRGFRVPCMACANYLHSLELLCRFVLGLDPIQPGQTVLQILAALDSPTVKSQRASALRELASTLSDAGDAFVSCADAKAEIIDPKLLQLLLDALASARHVPAARDMARLLAVRGTPFCKTEEALLYFAVSALFYKRAGEHKSHSFQLTKILYLLREYLAIEGPRGRRWLEPELLAQLKESLVWRAIRGVYRTHESAHRLEIETFQEILELDPDLPERQPNVWLNDLSLSFEVREIVIALHEIELKSQANRPAVPPDNRWLEPPYRFVSPYSSVNSIYNRIHELRFRGNVNYQYFKLFGLDKIKSVKRQSPTEEKAELQQILGNAKKLGCARLLGGWDVGADEVAEFLITDSIFCFHEVLRSLQIYGLSYMANHSMRAAAHDKLAQWCAFYYAYRRSAEGRRIREKLARLIGEADLITISPNYHRELAVVHYRSAIEVHSEGRAYKEIIAKMYYLNDDFNDKLTHFCASLERFRIHSGATLDRVETIAEELRSTTRLYDQARYYEPDPAGSAPPRTARTESPVQ